MKKVIHHGYATEGEQEQMKKTNIYSKYSKKEKVQKAKPTKASIKVKEAIMKKQVQKKTSEFKLGKFKKVPAKTNTNNVKRIKKEAKGLEGAKDKK